MPHPEIVITGIGVVSPIGVGREAFAQSLLQQKSGVGPIVSFDASGITCALGSRSAGLRFASIHS